MPKVFPTSDTKVENVHTSTQRVANYITKTKEDTEVRNTRVWCDTYDKKKLAELAAKLDDQGLTKEVTQYLNNINHSEWIADSPAENQAIKINSYAMGLQLCTTYLKLHSDNKAASEMLKKLNDSLAEKEKPSCPCSVQ